MVSRQHGKIFFFQAVPPKGVNSTKMFFVINFSFNHVLLIYLGGKYALINIDLPLKVLLVVIKD